MFAEPSVHPHSPHLIRLNLCPGGRERVYPHRAGRRQCGTGADRQGAEEAASSGGEADCRTGRVNQKAVRGERHWEDTRQAFQPPVGGVRHQAERIGAGGGGTEKGHHRPGRGRHEGAEVCFPCAAVHQF